MFSVCQLLWLSIIFLCGSVTLSCSLFLPSLLFSKDPFSVDRRESSSCISCSCPCSRSQTVTSLGIKAKFQNELKAPLRQVPQSRRRSRCSAQAPGPLPPENSALLPPCLRSPSPCSLPSSLPPLRCQLPRPGPCSPLCGHRPPPPPRIFQPCFSNCFPWH